MFISTPCRRARQLFDNSIDDQHNDHTPTITLRPMGLLSYQAPPIND